MEWASNWISLATCCMARVDFKHIMRKHPTEEMDTIEKRKCIFCRHRQIKFLQMVFCRITLWHLTGTQRVHCKRGKNYYHRSGRACGQVDSASCSVRTPWARDPRFEPESVMSVHIGIFQLFGFSSLFPKIRLIVQKKSRSCKKVQKNINYASSQTEK